MPLPLLQTKLYIPSPRPQLVARPSVVAKLRASIVQPLTLIAAPAGFGKTTLVSQWITQTEHAVAWLSLDEDDNDPTRFLTYVMAALQTQQAQISATAQGLLTASEAPSPKAILTLLLNDLGTNAAPLALVLDDYHLITNPAIHDALAFLVDHLPPSFHLVITSRVDPPLPLARWRVRNQLTELRIDDLRFRPAEAATFLNEVMGLALTADNIATLEMRTEGWIAGLQLAALSMQGRADVTGFIQAFSGSHRHVLSYLVEEVLNGAPAGTLDFLLHTALLERLTADLCNAVTDRSDSLHLLKKLEQANLFLIPLDDEGKWYRYHHLFAEVLCTRLYETQPHVIPHLQQRASVWYEQQELWSEAIHHALAADDFTRVARLIEHIGITFFAQANIQHSLNRWLATLPAPLIRDRPRLCLMYAWILFAHLDFAAALQRVAEAEAAYQRNPPQLADAPIAGEIAAMRALLTAYSLSLVPSEALVWGQQALAVLSVGQATFRCIAALGLGMAYMKQGDVLGAEQILAEANRMGVEANNIYLFSVAVSHQVAMQRARGALRLALTTCRETLAWMAQRGGLVYPTFGGFYLNLADLLREQNELDLALHYAQEAIAHSDQEINPSLFIISRLVLLRIHQARGEWAEAWRVLHEVATLAAQHPAVIHNMLLPAITAQFQVAEGISSNEPALRLTTALAWAQSTIWVEGAFLSAYRFLDFVYMAEHSRIVRAQIFIAWARATNDPLRLQETLVYLQRQQQIAEETGLLWYQIKIQLLQALAHHALGATEAARTALTHALRLAQPEGFVRVFVDEGEPLRLLIGAFRLTIDDASLQPYVDRLIAAFEGEKTTQPEIRENRVDEKIVNPKPKIQNLVEPLSDRELEVLQLVIAGLSNNEIANRLIVSTSTVKTHVNHIFGKLAVQSRAQAIARAHALGLFNA